MQTIINALLYCVMNIDNRQAFSRNRNHSYYNQNIKPSNNNRYMKDLAKGYIIDIGQGLSHVGIEHNFVDNSRWDFIRRWYDFKYQRQLNSTSPTQDGGNNKSGSILFQNNKNESSDNLRMLIQSLTLTR